MKFTKMHGAGNDYVYVDCFSEPIPTDPARLAIEVSDRHKGVGGDGLILICPSEVADARMRMYNADGSEAEMCGNGIRCVAKYVFDHGICPRSEMKIETEAGVLELKLEIEGDRASRVTVDMGEPILPAEEIPTRLAGDPVLNVPLEVEGTTYAVTCVSMGNPHCVIFVDEATDDLVHRVGPMIENHDAFPARVNVEFVEILSESELRQRTWERGSGETLACGTGASAVCVAGALTGRSQRQVLIHLLGGDLELNWDEDSNRVLKTGPAVEVFTGQWDESSSRSLVKQ